MEENTRTLPNSEIPIKHFLKKVFGNSDPPIIDRQPETFPYTIILDLRRMTLEQQIHLAAWITDSLSIPPTSFLASLAGKPTLVVKLKTKRKTPNIPKGTSAYKQKLKTWARARGKH